MTMRAAALALAVALAMGPVGAWPTAAWADDDTTPPDENTVNPQQTPDSSFIYDTSIADLYSADSYLNNQTVQVTGEVVGDRINAEFDDANCWIALQAVDGSNSDIPVFMTKVASKAIDRYGAYGVRGTTLQVRGTFHLSCPEHDGLTDLHADHVSVVARGETLRDPLDPAAFIPGAVMVVLGLGLILVFYRLRESRR
ncbi:MAG: hydrolase [Eggerthellaceae bacterium]|nr:hydrolase [Eggerthellaceae bacterium]